MNISVLTNCHFDETNYTKYKGNYSKQQYILSCWNDSYCTEAVSKTWFQLCLQQTQR